MPRRAHTAGCVVNSLSSNLSSQYRGIWVSDALLTETLRRFCNPPRRHGSNVPGPLESRRRSSKRRNTSLAYSGGGANIYDPSIMHGMGSRDQWWQEPGRLQALPTARPPADLVQEQSAATTSILPSWLIRALAPQKALESDTQEVEDSLVSQFESDVSMEDLKLDLQRRLTQTTSLQSIESEIQGLEPNFRRYPELSQLVFRHLLQLDGERQQYDQVAQALYNPAWNPPGSSNLLIVLQHICSSRVPYQSWTSYLIPGLLNAIELGLVSAQSVQEVISLIPKICQTQLGPQSESLIHATWRQIFTAIEGSRVLHLTDLDVPFLKALYQQIDNAVNVDNNVLSLLWQLKEHAGMLELKLASELIVRRLKTIAETGEETTGGLEDWFATVAKEMQGAALIQVTFKLIELADWDEVIGARLLKIWSVMLPQLHPRQHKHFPITEISWAQTRSIACTLSPPQQVLSVIWVAAALWTSGNYATTQFKGWGVQNQFKAIFVDNQDRSEVDFVGRVVSDLDTLPLPDKDRVFQYLYLYSDRKLIKMLSTDIYKDGLKKIFRRDYLILQNNAFELQARREFFDVYRSLCESINADLRSFKVMAQVLILRDREYFRVVARLLRYNKTLRFALTQSWPMTIAKHKKRGYKGALDPAMVLSIVEQLTMTFAITPITTPRSAFRHVYRMYVFLHMAGAPINPVVARALWHAGVTRYGQTRASFTQVRWCLSKVRDIEGPEVAEHLLWSAGYRRNYLAKFANNVKKDQELLELKVAEMLGVEPIEELRKAYGVTILVGNRELPNTAASDRLDSIPWDSFAHPEQAIETQSISTTPVSDVLVECTSVQRPATNGDIQHSTAQHSTAQHSTAQHSTAQHSTAQHSTAQHSTAQHSTAQHSTAQHSTAQRSAVIDIRF